MKYIKREIEKDKYESIKNMSYKEQHSALFPKGVPVQWELGYGYYGHSLKEEDGKYFAVFTIGNSCD